MDSRSCASASESITLDWCGMVSSSKNDVTWQANGCRDSLPSRCRGSDLNGAMPYTWRRDVTHHGASAYMPPSRRKSMYRKRRSTIRTRCARSALRATRNHPSNATEEGVDGAAPVDAQVRAHKSLGKPSQHAGFPHRPHPIRSGKRTTTIKAKNLRTSVYVAAVRTRRPPWTCCPTTTALRCRHTRARSGR